LAGRIAFRFSLLYWALYLLPSAGTASLVDLLPWGGDKLSAWMGWPLAKLAHWAGFYVFHLSGEGADWHPTGSGDTAMNYLLTACVFVLAVAGTAIWSGIDERRGGRREYRAAYAWLRLILRFTLAVTLFSYGFAKVFPGQFGLAPGLRELSETYGESSPMHVLWFFMGMSRPYTIFGGFAEVIPGVLLLFRRTTTLGLLGATVVMANIVALNFCYDVPVKLYSTHLLLLSLYLLLPDIRPMWTFFVRRRDAQLTGVWLPRWERKPLRIAAHVLQGIVVFACAWAFVGGSYSQRQQPDTPSPLRGVWAVDALEGWPGGDRPRMLVLDNNQFATAIWENGQRKLFLVRYDEGRHEIRFTKQEKDTLLHWDGADPHKEQLRGTWMGVPVVVSVHRTNPDVYPLLTRGFHWVQENPVNR
jgi:uncharacterized membrane protein YphA (DoxX/SURF4 family)